MRRVVDLLSSRAVQLALMVLLAGAAVVLADAEGGRQIADDAAVQRAAESLHSATAVTDAAMRQAVVVARAREEGVARRAEVESARRLLEDRLVELEARADILGEMIDDPAAVRSAHLVYSDQVERVADNLTSGRIESVWNEVDPIAYENLTGLASRIQDERQVHIINIEEGVETVSAAARLFVGLALPILVLLLLYRGLRQRQRQVILGEELRREKDLRKAKDRFLNGASHHLNTPLTAVLGFAQLLSDGHRKFTASERSELIELLAIQAEEASHVAEDLLIAARSDMSEVSLDKSNVDLRKALEQAVQGWDGAELGRLEISGNAIAVGDTLRVSQIIRNTLRNAVAYGGKSVSVAIESGPTARVTVTDDGPGIPEASADKLFQPYYTRPSPNGIPPTMGLGLSVARRLARAMGGELTFHRGAGRNVFVLDLPKAADSAPAVPALDFVVDSSTARPAPIEIAALLDRGGPPVIFQPIVDIKAHENDEHAVVGYEGLARFPYSTPDQWFRVADVAGRRLDLELRCIEAAVQGFVPEGGEFLAINLSEEALGSSRLAALLASAPATQIVLELSETATIKNYQKTKRGLDRLRKQGVRLAIDDIGAAEIDLWHIVRLGASVVKLDMSLVSDLDHSPSSRGFVRALLAMAEELNIILIGEGVETEREHRALLELGVPYGQGFYYGRPQPLGEWKTLRVIAD